VHRDGGLRQDAWLAFHQRGAVLLNAAQKTTLPTLMWPRANLSPAVIGQSAQAIAQRAGWADIAAREPASRWVEERHEDGIGHKHPFSGEKLIPVADAVPPADSTPQPKSSRHLRLRSAGHWSACTRARRRATVLGLTLPVSRVSVRPGTLHRHRAASTTGCRSSLSMGFGPGVKNNFSDNKLPHYLNITRISRPIPERVPTEQESRYFVRPRFGAR